MGELQMESQALGSSLTSPSWGGLLEREPMKGSSSSPSALQMKKSILKIKKHDCWKPWARLSEYPGIESAKYKLLCPANVGNHKMIRDKWKILLSLQSFNLFNLNNLDKKKKHNTLTRSLQRKAKILFAFDSICGLRDLVFLSGILTAADLVFSRPWG